MAADYVFTDKRTIETDNLDFLKVVLALLGYMIHSETFKPEKKTTWVHAIRIPKLGELKT